MIFIYFLIVILLLFVLFLFLPVGFELKFGTNTETVFVFKIFNFKIPISKKNNAERKGKNKAESNRKNSLKNKFKGCSFANKVSFVTEIIKEIVKKIVFLLKYINIKHMKADITVATENAAFTAIEYGTVCAVVYPLISFISNYKKLNAEDILINCDYSSEKSVFNIEAEVHIRVIYAFIVLVNAYFVVKKSMKGK